MRPHLGGRSRLPCVVIGGAFFLVGCTETPPPKTAALVATVVTASAPKVEAPPPLEVDTLLLLDVSGSMHIPAAPGISTNRFQWERTAVLDWLADRKNGRVGRDGGDTVVVERRC